jgi:hypothetical protein
MVSKFKKTVFSAGMFAPKAPKAPPAGSLDFGSITPRDMTLILQIANRGSRLSHHYRLTQDKRDAVIEANPEIVAIDIAVVHLTRRLHLQSFLECDDLTFMAEYATIQKNIIRASQFFPRHVALRFALGS